MKHILFISPDNFFLKRTGGQVCDFAIVLKLSKNFVVHVATVTDTLITGNYENIIVHRLSRRYERVGSFRGKFDFFKQLFFDNLPRAASIVSHQDNYTLLERVIRDHGIATAVFNHIDAVPLHDLPVDSKILIHHNHESRLARDIAKMTTSRLKKVFYESESQKLETLEKSLRYKSFSNFALSADEVTALGAVLQQQCNLLPVQISETLLDYTGEDDYIYVFGNWDYLPTREGLEKLLDFINSTDIIISLKVSGYCSSEVFKTRLYNTKGVEYLGFVEESDVRYLLNRASITVIPVFSGAGVKIKVIEALECNACILTTDTALEGLPDQERLRQSVTVFTGLNDMMVKLSGLLLSADHRYMLRKNAYNYIQHYRELSEEAYKKIYMIINQD